MNLNVLIHNDGASARGPGVVYVQVEGIEDWNGPVGVVFT